MFFGIVLLLVAALISSVSAFYSVAGLIAIFPGSVVPIIIMGSALEIGKLTSAVFLHHYWKKISLVIKLYLVPSILVLMLITSMGTYGFLSKAHLSQTAPNSDIQAQVDLFDQQIAYQQSIITDNKKTLSQLDSQLAKISDLATSGSGVTRSLKLRDSQKADRSKLQNEINTAQAQINQLQIQKAPIAAKARKAEADVGPIKYIAQLIYGDKTNTDILERAVRWVIILIVCVFDPLAVVLAISASQLFEIAEQEKKEKLSEQPVENKIDTIVEIPELPRTDAEINLSTDIPINDSEKLHSNLDSQPEILENMEKPIESTPDSINNISEEVEVDGVDIVHRIQRFLNQDGHYK